MSIEPLDPSIAAFMQGKIHACPSRGHSTSFQLVDEFGDGKPYNGLAYEIIDYEDTVYTGKLDATGSGKVDDHYCGPVVLKLNQPFNGTEPLYKDLRAREHYPLPITELQVRAEKTRFFNKSGVRTQANPAKDVAANAAYYQVEVSELVKHVAHLPPLAHRSDPPNRVVHKLMRSAPKTRAFAQGDTSTPDSGASAIFSQGELATVELGFFPPPPKPKGIALLPNKHHVMEVRPMRALRPMLSTSNEFCALNLYQLSLMATLSYTDFGQEPNTQPVKTDSVSFPLQPSSGNWFGHALPQLDELWKVDALQPKKYFPLYEEVPYSKRLEVLPFDPSLYPEVNNPDLGDQQEHPAKLHFFDDRKQVDSTDTQAFITHHDELILISVRGTSEIRPDAMRDGDAYQVPFEEGEGKVHRGFYGGAQAVYPFVVSYLERFYSGQKLLITGHSLGGAIALILSEMLRRDPQYLPEIVLYTYGAPRAGDTIFIESAKALVHHRIVNQNDPVPSVPATWMNTFSKPKEMYAANVGLLALHPVGGFAFLILGMINLLGDDYGHHGDLRHFMPVTFGEGHKSSILWKPGCSTINDHGCAKALRAINGLPDRVSFFRQLLAAGQHSMVNSYIPGCWASLRRWQEAQQLKRSLVTHREFEWVSGVLDNIEKQLRAVERGIRAHPSAYVRHQERNDKTAALNNEIDKIKMTQARLVALRGQRVTEVDVYGSYADQPEWVEESLLRWNAHPENLVREQLAMIPPAAEDHDAAIAAMTGGHAVGAPFHLDIDSIV
ncbi:lipase family protein [Pseudomonas fluorescens]|uniref:Lipase family protein n=1 Tax=Pseudomonas fluorescens TaxID=294 RepID=A0A3S5E9Z0_PSEFL|nr:lipase family protein [Pseudomonas fluorescens]VEF13697.1 lipase family protein [Pseudomonas fluorescens]